MEIDELPLNEGINNETCIFEENYEDESEE